MSRKPSQAKIAFDALCAISFLCLNETATLDDARRIAQQALRALGKDAVRYTVNRATGGIVTTCASGDYEKEQELSRLFVEGVLTPIIEMQHPDLPPPEWKQTKIADHPDPVKSEDTP